MAHLINHLQFEVNLPDEDQAFNLRHNFAVTFQEQIVEVVDKICSKYVSEDQWIRIDKLEIDLGRLTPQSFDLNFTEIFQDKFEKLLTEKLSEFSASQKKVSRQLSRAELLRYFLKKGTLPWWADETQIELDEISLNLLANEPEMLRQFFYEHRSEPMVWQRVALQLNTVTKGSIISLIKELLKAKKLFKSWIYQINVLISDEIKSHSKFSEESLNNIILKNAVKIFQGENDKTAGWKIFENNIEEIFLENKTLIKQIIQENKTVLSQIDEEKIKSIREKKQTEQNSMKIDSTLNHGLFDVSHKEEELADKYLVKHGGIILLAPFLNSFFSNLDLLQELKWKNKDAQYKAVHLLKFLSTGRQKTPEYSLTLEKIICGMAIDEPIPVEVQLQEKETNEAEMLLESVIEHWKALKNTSVNGLRETFLKRDGLIKKQENDWLLQVERKTLDVLIDSIPWGYSTITLPWNYYLIFVEW